MAKTETVHTRVTYEIKEKADIVFSKLGLTTSQAIMLFLTASVNKNGIPFELTLPTEAEQDLAFATAVATVDGVEFNYNDGNQLLLVDTFQSAYTLKEAFEKGLINHDDLVSISEALNNN